MKIINLHFMGIITWLGINWYTNAHNAHNQLVTITHNISNNNNNNNDSSNNSKSTKYKKCKSDIKLTMAAISQNDIKEYRTAAHELYKHNHWKTSKSQTSTTNIINNSLPIEGEQGIRNSPSSQEEIFLTTKTGMSLLKPNLNDRGKRALITSASHNQHIHLHRHKRYLLFPEGSSLHLVFEMIAPLLDYSNYIVVSLTTGMVWELPSQLSAQLIDNYRNELSKSRTKPTINYIYDTSRSDGDNDSNSDNNDDDNNVGTTKSRKQIFKSTKLPTANKILNSNKSPSRNRVLQISPHTQNQHTKYEQQPDYKHLSLEPFQYQRQLIPQLKRRPQQFLEQRPQIWLNSFPTDGNYQRKTFLDSANKNGYNPPPYKYHWKENIWNPHPILPMQTAKLPTLKQQQQQQANVPYFKQVQRQQQPKLQRKLLKQPPEHRRYDVYGRHRYKRDSWITTLASKSDSNGDSKSNKIIDDYDIDKNNVGQQFTKQLHDMHVQQHLLTRQKLYHKIEQLYSSNGYNGSACVLKAICEAEQIQQQQQGKGLSQPPSPQSFLAELLHSIFILPPLAPNQLALHINPLYIEPRLLAAQMPNCYSLYKCSHSIWWFANSNY